jgi:LysR family transcriptional regulator for metE and metH
VQRIARPALEVRDLELVLALAEARTTTRASALLHLTQSAVSRGLLSAEDKLGVSLFERTPRGLVPTPAGARLIEGAGTLLSQMVELEQQARSPVAVPRIRLVCECYTAYRWLPSAISQLRRAANVEIDLLFEHTSDPVAGLAAGELDLALLTTGKIRPPLRDLPLFADEIVFVVAADHPLAARASLTPDDLREYPLISSTNTPEPELRWFVTSMFGRRMPTLERLRFPLTEAIVDAARAGMGIAVLSEWIAQPYLDHTLVAKRLRKPLRRPWRLAFRPDRADRAHQLAAALGGLAPRLYAQRA